MKKNEFLEKLREELPGVPTEELEERLDFISEIIDDKVEDGMSEDDAVGEIGTVGETARRIMSEIPFTTLIKEKAKRKKAEISLGKNKTMSLNISVLGLIWLPLVIAFAAVALLFAIFEIVLCSLVITLYCIDISFAASTLACVILCGIYAANANAVGITVCVGCVLFFFGSTVLLFFASKAATEGMIKLIKNTVFKIKTKI